MLSLIAAGLAFSDMDLVVLPDALVATHAAYCMDGSAGAYYVERASAAANATKWVVYIEGGGECRTLDDCKQWQASHTMSASGPKTRIAPLDSPMSADVEENPDFGSWNKLYLPYCSGDMHAGTTTARNAALGGWFFSGHNIIAATVAHLGANGTLFPQVTHALISGGSAGGIATIMHTDFFAEQWAGPAGGGAVVKGNPGCGFFYAGVTALPDYEAGAPTPLSNLGFVDAWQPYLPAGCAAATGGNMSACTDAHTLYPHLRSPLFIMENQYDTAKLANCGLDSRDISTAAQLAYVKAWGGWMRAQLAAIAAGAKNGSDGFFSASCLQHGGNFGFASSPVVNGRHMRDAISNWFFERGDDALRFTADHCGDLPCTPATGRESCPHIAPPAPAPGPGPPPAPISDACKAQLETDCPGERGKGDECHTCVRAHAADLKQHGCPQSPGPVFAYYCDGPGPAPPPAPTPAPAPPTPISAACKAQLTTDCPGEMGRGATCRACVSSHAGDLRQHDCPAEAAPVFAYFCDDGGLLPAFWRGSSAAHAADARARQWSDAAAGRNVINSVGTAEEHDYRFGAVNGGHHVCDLLAASLGQSKPGVWRD